MSQENAEKSENQSVQENGAPGSYRANTWAFGKKEEQVLEWTEMKS